jgi:hypothetical protein
MEVTRRDLVKLAGMAGAAGLTPRALADAGDAPERLLEFGWASLGEADGPPAWDVVAGHLRALKRVRLDPRPRVRVS